jgi:hypothetical protein
VYIWGVQNKVAKAAGLGRPEIDTYMLRLNLRLIAEHPLEYVSVVGDATSDYSALSATGLAFAESKALQLGYALLHYLIVALFVVQVVAVMGLQFARRLGAKLRGPFTDPRAMPVWWIGLAIVLYNALVSVTIEVGDPRSRTPTDCLILLVVFGGMYMSAEALKRPTSAIRGA